MRNNPELIQKYDIITDQREKGIIEKVGSESNSLIKHYIPHHAVVNPTKATTKARVVYDASAKCRSESRSLNECLTGGFLLLQNFSVAISVSPHVCFILVLILISKFLR